MRLLRIDDGGGIVWCGRCGWGLRVEADLFRRLWRCEALSEEQKRALWHPHNGTPQRPNRDGEVCHALHP